MQILGVEGLDFFEELLLILSSLDFLFLVLLVFLLLL